MRLTRYTPLAVLCLLLVAACALPVAAEIRAGELPPPEMEPGPTDPGLYAGIKDNDGVAVSWVRVEGLKERGRLVGALRGIWGQGSVEVPLVDIRSADLYYSEGNLHVDLTLRSGEPMQLELADPYSQLTGWWRDNSYAIPLSGVRQMWFLYVATTQGRSTRYNGPPVVERMEGVVQGIDLRGGGGSLSMLSSHGDVVDLHFDYRKMLSGADLLLNRAAWVVGRPVRVTYRLTSGPGGVAERNVRQVELLKAEATR